jgi:Flp pilus assembly protein TadD
VGFATGTPVTAGEWLLTQAGVVAWYVRLAAWPQGLRGAYDWGIVRSVGDAVPPGLFVLALLAIGIALWWRRPWWGFLFALFFLLLAPTSSVVPIVTEIVAERRAYLPMLLVVVPAVFGCRALLRRLWPGGQPAAAVLVGTAAVVGLGLLARFHAAHYADERSFWQHAWQQSDPASRSMLMGQILSNQAAMLYRAGQTEEAAALIERAMRCEAPGWVEFTQYAVILQQRGRAEEAYALFERAIALRPTYAEAHGSYGTSLLMEYERAPRGPDDPRLLRATTALQRAVELAPRRMAYWYALGGALWRRGRLLEAEAAYRRATALPFQRLEPFANLAELLAQLGRGHEVAALWQGLLAARPGDAELRVQLAQHVLGKGDRAGATTLLREALAIQPGFPAAVRLLRELEAGRGR